MNCTGLLLMRNQGYISVTHRGMFHHHMKKKSNLHYYPCDGLYVLSFFSFLTFAAN